MASEYMDRQRARRILEEQLEKATWRQKTQLIILMLGELDFGAPCQVKIVPVGEKLDDFLQKTITAFRGVSKPTRIRLTRGLITEVFEGDEDGIDKDGEYVAANSTESGFDYQPHTESPDDDDDIDIINEEYEENSEYYPLPF